MVIDKSQEARRRLGIRRGERIYGAVLLGYPAVQFRNKVEGRTLDVVWNGEPSAVFHPALRIAAR